VKIVSTAGVPVFVHAFLDGRDTPPKSAKTYAEKFLADIHGLAGVRLATISGRYYAMDRDKRWTGWRRAITRSSMRRAAGFDDAGAALDSSYAEGITDEFVIPCILGDYAGVEDGDVLLSPISAPTGRGRFPPLCWTRALTVLPAIASRNSAPRRGLPNIPMP